MKNNIILQIKDLTLQTQTTLLKNSNLRLNKGTLNILTGLNGSGKSSLLHYIAGNFINLKSKGQLFYNNKNITLMNPELRASKGIFLSFQTPFEFTNIYNFDFLQLLYTYTLKKSKKFNLNALEFLQNLQEKLKKISFNFNLLKRYLNLNFSGGEKKKNELLQLFLLQPKLLLLDEIDTGLDFITRKEFIYLIKNHFGYTNTILLITHSIDLIKKLNPNNIYIIQDQIIKKITIESINKYLRRYD